MRVVLFFLVLVILAVVGYFAAQKMGWLPGAGNTSGIDVPTEVQETPDVEPADTGIKPPRFDIVRVDRSGFAVIAGVAAPGASVTLYANGEELVTETAGPDGAWAINTETPLKSGTVELTLSMTTLDGLEIGSDETIVVYVPEREGDQPLILRTTPGGASEVLQRPTDRPAGLGPLSLDTIDYDDAGSVIFSGMASPGSTVQVFANRNFIDQAIASDDGTWTMSTSIVPGRYTLQIIQLDEFGNPAYAIEVPFERASFSDVVFRDGNVIVQPGNSLWVISRRAYGEGAQYTIIYEANQSQIRDPDLIYPGQIFDVPGAEEEDTPTTPEPEMVDENEEEEETADQ